MMTAVIGASAPPDEEHLNKTAAAAARVSGCSGLCAQDLR
jgi:hypothetical protein